MFAVVETGGKQYHVKKGDVISVEKMDGNAGDEVVLDKVLFCNDNVAKDFSGNIAVKAEILEQLRSDKVIVFKKKRRQNYRRKMGHRQDITLLRIKEVMC